MGEYEDRYPDAFGRGEEIDPEPRRRHFLGIGLPRQVRNDEPAVAEARTEAPAVVNIEEPLPDRAAVGQPPPPPRHAERPRQPLIQRTPREICDDVYEQLNASPFIDASGVSITVDGADVRLEGTINSLIAISLAKALASNVPGVGRVEVQLRVQPRAQVHETPEPPVYKVAE